VLNGEKTWISLADVADHFLVIAWTDLDKKKKGDPSGMPLAMGLGYMENVAPANINEGLIKTAMKIDHHRSLIDTSTCQTFTEVIVTNKEKPYVLGTRLRVTNVATGQSVTVRVNDRGPFIAGRVVDVSHSAAQALGMVDRGITKVPGLSFVGLPWQHTRGSALLGWVKDDALFIAQRIDAFAQSRATSSTQLASEAGSR